jgi:hypothetical protein
MKEGKAFTKPIMIEVVSIMLTVQTVECKNCRISFRDIPLECDFIDREIDEYPEDLKEQVLRLSNWIRELIQLYSNQIQVKVIDALSPLGLYKKLRYRIKEFPAFIVDHEETYSGWDKKALEAILNRHLQLRAA